MKPESDKAAAAAGKAAVPAKKDRRIVSWTLEEDQLLRDQITAQGADNWPSIAAKFKDKTSRQCRRRWYTYLNSEGKKGGWSPEEDMLLCEAQKIFGNRWTEIAKVVSGRTDNAVKNRFSTLCKKQAKTDALTKENDGSSVKTNNKRGIIQNESCMTGEAESSAPMKQIRYQNFDHTENIYPNERLPMQPVKGGGPIRSPLSVLSQNINNVGVFPRPCQPKDSKPAMQGGSNNRTQGSFLQKDDPKLNALLQQAELLSSLALKVNSDNNIQSLENAWKELQDYLIQNGEEGLSATTFDIDFPLDDLRSIIEDLESDCTSEQPSWRHPGLQEGSQDSSQHSIGSAQEFQVDTSDSHPTDNTLSDQIPIVSCHQEDDLWPLLCSSQDLSSSEEQREIAGNVCTAPSSEFDSPFQTIPTFKSSAEEIPSPKFSSSERRFLLSVLASPPPISSSAQQPSCKRVLLDSL